jgi:hypothetical protein
MRLFPGPKSSIRQEPSVFLNVVNLVNLVNLDNLVNQVKNLVLFFYNFLHIPKSSQPDQSNKLQIQQI